MIIDVHVHLWRYGEHLGYEFASEVARITGGLPQDVTQSAEEIIPKMEEAMIDVSVIIGFRAARLSVLISNEYLAEVVHTYPNRLLALAGVDPSVDDVATESKRAIFEFHLNGFKLVPSYAGFSPTDKRLWSLYEIAQEARVPVMLHLSAAITREALFLFAHPRPIEEVALAFPDLRLILAHLCYPWEEEAMCLARRFPNIFLDISGFSRRPWLLYRDLFLAMEYGVLDRILYGSDSPFHTSSGEFLDLVRGINNFRAQGLPEIPLSSIEGIIGENARRLFGLQKI
jgi:uncharacterized protein